MCHWGRTGSCYGGGAVQDFGSGIASPILLLSDLVFNSVGLTGDALSQPSVVIPSISTSQTLSL